jgi:hypothetical protein
MRSTARDQVLPSTTADPLKAIPCVVLLRIVTGPPMRAVLSVLATMA